MRTNRLEKELYPDFTAEINAIKSDGVSTGLIYKIIQKHRYNSKFNKNLYDRYKAVNDSVPIFKRKPRFDEGSAINNQVNNDFFGEIVDFKTGYFAGQPVSYGYAKGEESENNIGGAENIKIATKAVSDFVTRNNMYGCDMEVTKLASIAGYAGRLLYIDLDGNERVMPIPAHESIILSDTDISEPQYAIRYYKTTDINNVASWIVEFYDNIKVYTYGGYLSNLKELKQPEPHRFEYCPLQGIANNAELLGDAEKVLALIDDYDKVLSDNSNEVESFVHAYMVVENLKIDDEVMRKAQKSGAFKIMNTGTKEGKIYFLTKDINDAFTEHHLERLEDNIYRFSKTPNLNDENFGQATGVAMKFKLHGLETKCGMFQSKMIDANTFMWKCLSTAFEKKDIPFDYLYVTMEFTRNFPLDTKSEAETVQTLINAGVPKEVAYGQLSFIDDVDYVMQIIESEKENISLGNVNNDENNDIIPEDEKNKDDK